ncbi:hypothetical protein EDC96DRAFT_177793 [Choanephora cucurbitarum]|nr:hypothetical protein EDC96DRAFT_177793 [Choanephora cucurbitarum]
MSYSRSPTASNDDWLSRGPPSSRTYSTNSSRNASRSQSQTSSASRGHTSGASLESTAKAYLVELKKFLRDFLEQEAIEGPQPQRISARQKLTRLSNSQFHELAMDVYDEVVRKNKNDKFLPFLPVKEEFHPKRNQARQKLATLPIERFQDLASDVFSELNRRFPGLVENDPPVPQIPQPSKSTNIVPVKGTISVENIAGLSDDDYEEAAASYQEKMNSARTPISPSESNDFFSRSRKNSEVEKVKSDYEYQINIMTNRIKQLQHEVDHNSTRQYQDIETLKMKDPNGQKALDDMEEKYNSMKQKYDRLAEEHKEQQIAVQEVKRETKQMLDELKRLNTLNEELLNEKEKTDNLIQELNKESKKWKMKYDKARIELRSLRAASVIEPSHSHSMFQDSYLQPTTNGIVDQDHILTYQNYIEELLTVARTTDPSQVIQVMKNIVTVCRNITEEIEKKEDGLSSASRDSLYDLKTKFSTSLSDLLMAAKYHANGMGISPVSLLDRSASHLTAVIVDLTKLLGMHSSKASEASSLPPIMVDRQKYQNSSSSNIPTKLRASESTMSGFNSPFLNKQFHSDPDEAPTDLVKYLKTETDHIVQTIQTLLAILRSPYQSQEAHSIISELIEIVAAIIKLARSTCQTSFGSPYRSDCEAIIGQLRSCSQRIESIQTQYFESGALATAAAKRDLARESYEIAKLTKELITLFEDESF